MSPKKNETEYLYVSSFVHAREKILLSREKYDRLAYAPDTLSLFRLLKEYGYSFPAESGDYIDSALDKTLSERISEMEKVTPNGENLKIFRLPYDCMNLKAAIKCIVKDGFNFESLASECGSVPISEYGRIMEKRDFSSFTPGLAAAAKEAEQIYNKTRDPQLFDIELDKACFRDMLTIAENSREGVYKEYVSAKIDISNIVMCIRSMRMEKPLSFFKSVFINGGSLDIGYFEEIYGEDTEKFFAAVSKTRYGKAFSLDITAGNPFGMDRAAAKYMLGFSKELLNSVFGAGAVMGFILVCENEIKNIRIIFSGKKAGISPRRICERINYV